ncbi:MAG: type II secretion system ATPase GspE [Myxococcales bacterium]|nr:type II secretion system ATPase GspE [Myxococcales bacterium]
MEPRFVGDILVRRGAVTADTLERAVTSAEERGVDIIDVLLASSTVQPLDLVRALAEESGMEVLEAIRTDDIPVELIDLVPITFARTHGLLPIATTDDEVRVAISNPLDLEPLDDLRVLLGKRVQPVAAPLDAIEDAINRVYERKDEAALEERDDEDEAEELQDLIDMTDEAPVIRWVNNLFYTAIRDRASDIHVEPTEREVIVRYRVDGKLLPKKTAHRGFLPSIVSRIKIEAGLNIAEKRLPQDGRITKKVAGKLVDVRVSTVPTAKGERIVMRLLDKEQVLHDLPELGFDPGQLKVMTHFITRPNGIILVTGPTGSGKTTTLYSCLAKINLPDKNILTVEDPVEYELKGIGQMQVRPKIGLTFASGLRSFLRQDPDVIMVGEIRDQETAEIAIHASLTGHLVLSTLHTNDAPGAVTRLVDMGIQPYQISSSVMAILAQRLVRRLCHVCRQPYFPSDADIRELGVEPEDIMELLREARRSSAPPPPHTGEFTEDTVVAPLPAPEPSQEGRPVFYRASGCEECIQTGYRGRIGIYELMVIDEPVRREILNNSDSNTIQKIARQRGMRTLREDGAHKVLRGFTSVDEVLAATQAGDVE